jgi:hypothetical protein
MKDIDIYLLVTGLFIVAGFVSSSGVDSSARILDQEDYVSFGVLACGLAVGFVVYKLHQKKSSNN